MNLPLPPRVSIILPVYNRAHVISRALTSILNQSFKDIEVLLVNDASTDNLNTALMAYSDPRLRILEHTYNKGAAAARNTGIKAARGELIAFLDSDDEWSQTKLEEQISHFEQSKQENRNVAGSFTSFYLKKPNDTEEIRRFKTIKKWKHYFLEGCLISPGSTLLVEKGVYKDIGLYDQSLERFEDWDWLLRFSKKYQLVAYDSPLSKVYLEKKCLYQSVPSALKKMTRKHRKELSFYEKIKFLTTCQLELCYSHMDQRPLTASWYLFSALLLNCIALNNVWGRLFQRLKTSSPLKT